MTNEDKLNNLTGNCLRFFNDPVAGDVWHDRFTIVLAVIAFIDDLVVVANTYIKNNERYIHDDVESFAVYTKQEFLDKIYFCDCIRGSIFLKEKPWLKKIFGDNQLSYDGNITEPLLELVKKKKEYIKFKDDPNYIGFINPSCGDVWKLDYTSDERYFAVVDRYLKNYLIVSFQDHSPDENSPIFSKLQIISVQQFRSMVLNTESIENGFKANVRLQKLKDVLENLKLTN